MHQMPADIAPVFVMVFLAAFLFFMLLSTAITLLIWCRLFGRAGFHWALGLLMLVPIANMIMPFYLAFAEWPIRRQLETLQARQAA